MRCSPSSRTLDGADPLAASRLEQLDGVSRNSVLGVCRGGLHLPGVPVHHRPTGEKHGAAPGRRGALRSVSFILAAHNEAVSAPRWTDQSPSITAMRRSSSPMARPTPRPTSHGLSTDQVRVVELRRKEGKAAARHTGCVLGDASPRFRRPDACRPGCGSPCSAQLRRSGVGAATGDLVLGAAPGVLAGVGLTGASINGCAGRESLVFSMIGA